MEWYNDPVYQKMCEKAVKIQDGWEPSNGDWFTPRYNLDGTDDWESSKFKKTEDRDADLKKGQVYTSGDLAGYCYTGLEDYRAYLDAKKHTIWLPRQDQLQGMVLEGYSDWEKISLEFCPFIEMRFEYTIQFKSMEQLWLAFVMKEKFGKVWDGEVWIKGGEYESAKRDNNG